MSRNRWATVFGACLVIPIAIVAFAATIDPAGGGTKATAPSGKTSHIVKATSVNDDQLPEVQLAVVEYNVRTYQQLLVQKAFDDWMTQLAFQDWLASLPKYSPPSVSQSSMSYSTSTPAGGHSDAWWSGVATCEQGGRNDPYYGYFSFMDGSQGGKPWDEQVAAGNALLASAGREVGPWAASCVAAGYNASPGG